MNIFEAVEAGDTNEIVKNIAQINSVDKDGNTALMLAVSKDQSRSIIMLLFHHADVHVQNKELDTALTLAVKKNLVSVVSLLLSKGASPNHHDAKGDTPLIIATKAGLLGLVTLLLEHNVNIDDVDKGGCTALRWASEKNNVAITHLLVKNGADPDVPAKGGTTALIIAAHSGCNEVILILLERGADPNLCTTENRNTALIWAVTKSSHASVKALLGAGAVVNHTTASGDTPLRLATDPLVKRLLKAYQQLGGPSWLVRELGARGLEWSVVCDVEDKLAKEGCATRESLLQLPLSQFTHCYLERIGVEALFVRQALLDLRLQCTWLGARLVALGVTNSCLAACEFAVLHSLGCSSEASFAQVLPEELCDLCLMRMRIESGFVRRCLRAVHEQVRSENHMPSSSTTNSITSATTTSSTSSAATAYTSAASVLLSSPITQSTTETLQMSDAGPLLRRADAPPPQEVGNWEHL